MLAAATYDGGLFPCMEDFLYHLKLKNYQKRTVGILENGSWAPMAGKLMKEYVEGFRDCVLAEPVVTVKSVLNADSREQIRRLADAMAEETVKRDL